MREEFIGKCCHIHTLIYNIRAFSPFGEIIYIKIPIGKGCGFVQFVHRVSAEQAIAQRNQTLLGKLFIGISTPRGRFLTLS
jgi:hypothetical protein